jgi:transposase-like protein
VCGGCREQEALRGERTLNEIAAAYGVHPLQITQWKKVALEALPQVLSSRRGTKHKEEEALKAALYQQIGQLKVERRQCALWGLARSTLYDQPL